MRLVGKVALVAFVLVAAFADLPLWFQVPALYNEVLIERGAECLVLVTPSHWRMLFLLQGVALGYVLYAFRRRGCATTRGYRLLIILCWLLAARVVFVSVFVSSHGRSRLLRTADRVSALDSEVMQFRLEHDRFPTVIRELPLPAADLYDGWGCRLQFEVDDDRMGYWVWAACIPTEYRAGSAYRRCSAHRRFKKGSGWVSLKKVPGPR